MAQERMSKEAADEVTKLIAQSKEILDRIESILKKHEPSGEAAPAKNDPSPEAEQ